MYEELGSVKEPVELSSSEALGSAEELLRRQGYRIIHRTDAMVVGKRESPSSLVRRQALHLAVFARPHPKGGLRITLQGDDREGVRERQGEWSGWAESLPKLRMPQETGREGAAGTPRAGTAEPQSSRSENEASPGTGIGRSPTGKRRRTKPVAPGRPGRDLWPERSSGSAETKNSESPSRGSGTWTSVSPWERKVRIAPGKSDPAQGEATDDPKQGRGFRDPT